jgi:hypothetical protein
VTFKEISLFTIFWRTLQQFFPPNTPNNYNFSLMSLKWIEKRKRGLFIKIENKKYFILATGYCAIPGIFGS